MTRVLTFVAILGVCEVASAPSQIEADHVYIVVTTGAPEAKVLQESGFSLSPGINRHEGQGTASVTFTFVNAYLELMWIDDVEELQAADPALAARMQGVEPDSSPFGLGLRRLGDEDAILPFPTRSHSPEWMRPNSKISIATETKVEEPEVFVVPSYMSWLSAPASFREERTRHSNGVRALTSIRFSGPGLANPSATVGYLLEEEVVDVVEATEHVLELEFDGGRAGRSFDARPTLPLLVRY